MQNTGKTPIASTDEIDEQQAISRRKAAGNDTDCISTAEVIERRRCLSPAEFATISGLSLSTVRRYLKKQRLPMVQPHGPHGRILIPYDAVDAIGERGCLLRFDQSSVENSIPTITPPNESRQPTKARLGRRPKWQKQNESLKGTN